MGLRLKDAYKVMEEEGAFFNKLYEMVKTRELDPQVQKETKDKLKKAYYLMTTGIADGMVINSLLKKACFYLNNYLYFKQPRFYFAIKNPLPKINDYLLKKLQAKNADEATLNVVKQINAKYNPCQTNEEKWVNTGVLLREYCTKNRQELMDLKTLGSNARLIEVDCLAEKAEAVSERLAVEEKELREIVKDLNPENYQVSGYEDEFTRILNETSGLIREKLSLYGEHGRTPFLRVYNQHIKGDNPDRMEEAIWLAEAFDMEEGLTSLNLTKSEDPNTLESLSQSAQDLRLEYKVENPEKVIKRGKDTIEREI
jgi:hypothetical protein